MSTLRTSRSTQIEYDDADSAFRHELSKQIRELYEGKITDLRKSLIYELNYMRIRLADFKPGIEWERKSVEVGVLVEKINMTPHLNINCTCSEPSRFELVDGYTMLAIWVAFALSGVDRKLHIDVSNKGIRLKLKVAGEKIDKIYADAALFVINAAGIKADITEDGDIVRALIANEMALDFE